MKRTLSLILALAMIMSLFTTVSFAGTGTSLGDPINSSVSVTAPSTKLFNDKTATLTGKYTGESDSIQYYWISGTEAVATISNAGVVTPVDGKSGTVAFTLVAAVKGDGDSYTYYSGSKNVEILAEDSNKYYLTGAKADFKLTVNKTETAPTFTLKHKDTNTAADGALYKYASSNSSVATIGASGGTITAKGVGTANITCTATYAGATYTAVVATVTVASLDLATKSITNGSTSEGVYKAADLVSEVQKQIRAATGNTGYTVSSLKFKPTSLGHFTVYVDSIASGNKVAVNTTTAEFKGSSHKLIVVPTAGYVDNILLLTYTATNGTTPYSGTIAFKSTYDDTVKDTQSAHFFYEEFCLHAISGIDELDKDDDKKTPGGEDDYTDFTVNPNGAKADWTETYTGYDKSGVAKQVVVTFEPVEYDILAYVEEGKNPFGFEAFEAFAERVEAEQENHYDIEVDHVEFPTVSVSKKWTLEKNGKTIKSTDEFTASNIDDVYLDVTTAGYYDIPFEVHYDYKDSKNDTWSKNAPKHFKGLIRVYAALDGDLQYEVTYGETVKFDSADFAALYRKLTSSKKVLETVKIDALPLYGALYRNSKVTSAYAVDEGDVFYVDPASANSTYDLDKVTYWASKTDSEEYSVYVPVTMDGTGGEEVAVVEIVIKAGIPFKDIAKNSTFYDYIQYAYNNGIMGGKSETNFDAKSNITRAQLVTTLYRMAGSPTTYNGKVLPYSDTKYLSAEFSNALKWATAKGIATGYGSNFNPNSAVTRQAMVTILYRYAKTEGFGVGVTSVNNLGYFTDGAKVSSGMVDAMNWAVDYGLVSGNGSLLNPGGSTTRGAAAKILSNFHALYIG